MKTFAVAAVLVSMSSGVWADEVYWPTLNPGDVKVLSGDAVPGFVRDAAGYPAPAELPKDVKITAFMGPHRGEFAIISPCCGSNGGGAKIFSLIGDHLRDESITVGDPRNGFTTQPYADSITVDPDAKAVRAKIVNSDCDKGTWGYYYQFDEIGRLQLTSVIDTGCAHLGVREFYHTASRPSHWWQH